MDVNLIHCLGFYSLPRSDDMVCPRVGWPIESAKLCSLPGGHRLCYGQVGQADHSMVWSGVGRLASCPVPRRVLGMPGLGA